MSARTGKSRGSQLLEEWQGAATQQQAADLLNLDPASYSRFINGVRKPSGDLPFTIERVTKGHVPAESWYDPPLKEAASKGARAS